MAKNFIKKAIKHPGALHEMLGVAEGKNIPRERIEEASHSKNKLLRKRAILAKTLSGLHR